MAIKITHCGESYTCAVAVKCEYDKYIKLYDTNGAEIVSFSGISDFSAFTISGGSFVDPCDCAMPIPLTAYAIGGRTISTNNWILSGGKYHYEIENDLISANASTCDVLILFAEGTQLEYTATQEAGKITLFTEAAPIADVVIESIRITKA